jgi:hypothetical protein
MYHFSLSPPLFSVFFFWDCCRMSLSSAEWSNLILHHVPTLTKKITSCGPGFSLSVYYHYCMAISFTLCNSLVVLGFYSLFLHHLSTLLGKVFLESRQQQHTSLLRFVFVSQKWLILFKFNLWPNILVRARSVVRPKSKRIGRALFPRLRYGDDQYYGLARTRHEYLYFLLHAIWDWTYNFSLIFKFLFVLDYFFNVFESF